MRNSKCQHEVAELDGQGSKGALTVAYKIKLKMEYNVNTVNHTLKDARVHIQVKEMEQEF